MKQFWVIFKFELMSYFKNKIFVGITVLMVLLIIGALSVPRVMEVINFESEDITLEEDENLQNSDGESGIIYILDETTSLDDSDITEAMFADAMIDKEIKMTDESQEVLTKYVEDGECEAAIILHTSTEYTYIAKDITMYDSTEMIIQELMLQKYQLQTMVDLGLSEEESVNIMNATIEGNVIMLGKNQMDNFFYTYILIFGLYMAILLYGQFVAMGVATEKSSRAMEVLITSAKAEHLMFGKVLGAGSAGLLQIVVILGTAFAGYQANQSYFEGNWLVQSIFDMPFAILFYTIVFFVLGFLIYSFLYGAVGSLASKVEDINTSVMPITFLFLIAFFIVVTGMTSGNVDSGIMVFASYFPFTSPMAMFTRIAMGNVSLISIMISIVILILTTIGIGILSAKIYRLGVLMYGKPPKITTVLKMLIKK